VSQGEGTGEARKLSIAEPRLRHVELASEQGPKHASSDGVRELRYAASSTGATAATAVATAQVAEDFLTLRSTSGRDVPSGRHARAHHRRRRRVRPWGEPR
jgi:hypothetical protein